MTLAPFLVLALGHLFNINWVVSNRIRTFRCQLVRFGVITPAVLSISTLSPRWGQHQLIYRVLINLRAQTSQSPSSQASPLSQCFLLWPSSPRSHLKPPTIPNRSRRRSRRPRRPRPSALHQLWMIRKMTLGTRPRFTRAMITAN